MADLKPRLPIRRFDVFADYNFVKNESDGMPERQAKGRAIWAAKVVAGRRYGSAPAPKTSHADERPGHPARGAPETGLPPDEEEFRSVGGVQQTDRTFDKEIVDRMGQEFYEKTFHPAIAAAFAEGKRYEDIRDSIRKDWK